MRIAICTLSAVLLSGCSWLGMGNGSSANGCASGYGQYGGSWGQGAAGCDAYGSGQGGSHAGHNHAAFGHPGHNHAAYGHAAGAHPGHNHGAGQGFAGQGFAGQGYGAGFGAGGFGPGQGGIQGYLPGQGGAYAAAQAGYAAGQAGFGNSGAYGTGFNAGQAAAGQGFGQGTVLGQGAGFGTALGGVAGGQYAQYATGGQVVGGNVQQIQGAPIYVPRPYPAYYQAPRLRLGGAAQPLGLSGFGGITEFNEGNIFGGEAAKPASTTGRSVSELDAVSYETAFGEGDVYGATLEYDIDRNNTAFISASRAEFDGQTITNGTITQDNTSSGGAVFTDAGLYEYSDLEQTTIEAGLRRYVGNNLGFRPYVSGSAGFTHNNDVTLTTSTADTNVVATPETQEIIRESWQPTAAGLVGAEIAAGPNFNLGVETGVRWTNARATQSKSEDTWSVPVQVRGRIAF